MLILLTGLWSRKASYTARYRRKARVRSIAAARGEL